VCRFAHQRAKGHGVVVLHLATDNRKVSHLKALCLGRVCDLVKRGLIGAFAIRAIADDRPVTGISNLLYVGRSDLR
jgi:hypothetical protein